MADDWKEKLRQIKRSLDSEKQKRGQDKLGKGSRRFETVDPKTAWGRPAGSQRSTPQEQAESGAGGLPAAPDDGEGQAFNIGVDVGTSTLKICVRPPGLTSHVYVVPLSEKRRGSSLLCPATVTVEDGRLWFGQEARNRLRGIGCQAFRQLKMCVACEVGLRPEVPVSSCRCDRMEDGSCSAIFTVAGAPEAVLASDLLTLLLGWAMGESRRRIPAELTGNGLPRTTYSISAPIDQIDAGSKLNGEYARVVFQAWRLSDGIRQGMVLSEALAWIARVQGEPLPPAEERLVELCPESAAIVAGYAMSPEMEEGQYAVVDIGAWTTEMSFFRFTDIGRESTARPARAFHAARSHRVGANEIDDRCRRHVLDMYACEPGENRALAEAIRDERERGVFGEELIALDRQGREIAPRGSSLQFARDLVAEAIGRRFHETLAEAYENEKLESFWRGKLRVLFAGGGSLDEVLQSGINHPFIADARAVPVPSDLIGLPICDDYRRFLVAYGLAHGSARWPRDLLPSQALPFRPWRRPVVTSEELGYENP